MKKIKFSNFKQPLWQFEYLFLGLQGALECTMTSLLAPHDAQYKAM